MKVVQAYYSKAGGWKYLTDKTMLINPLVLVFGNRLLLQDEQAFAGIKTEFPYSHFVYGSTGGEIAGTHVMEESFSVIALDFEKSTFAIVTDSIYNHNSNAALLGAALYSQLPRQGLKHIFSLAGGNYINGSALIEGLEKEINAGVALTGGLCGDDERFECSVASYNEVPKEGEAVLIGLYGDDLEITYASFGGWQPFGPERIVTKSEGNILYEIDGKPALELYKKYLGEKANQELISLLSYPLSITPPGKDYSITRTILNIETDNNSIILAGNCPEGSKSQLLMASVHGIVDGAREAAEHAMVGRTKKPEAALLISCVGRKALMDQQVEEEIEMVQDVLGSTTAMAGFYSYGEMAPFFNSKSCELHNQTMTLTLISE
jgi:hypothetical protein